MVKRFTPAPDYRKPSKRGGKRNGAGRPKGSINHFSKLAIGLAKQTGKLPHELMLDWVRQGYIHQVRHTIHKDPTQKSGVRYEIARLENGEPEYEIIPLTVNERVRLAVDSANYYAPRLVASALSNAEPDNVIEGTLTPEEKIADEQLRRALLKPLPPEIQARFDGMKDVTPPKTKEEVN